MSTNNFLDELSSIYREAYGKKPKVIRQIVHAMTEMGVIRLDSEEEPDAWITVNGNHIPIDQDGKPIGGQMKALGTGATQNASRQGLASFAITKRKFNDKVKEIYDSADESGGFEKEANEIKKMLDELPAGSVVVIPAGDFYDSEQKLTKDEDGFWVSQNDFRESAIDLGYEFLYDEKNRARVTKIAMTHEEYQKALEQSEKTYWRNKEKIWQSGGSFCDTMELKLRKHDVDNCGDGIEVTGSDGNPYIKFDGKWYNAETLKEADMRKLKSPTFSGDFFAVNFGLNGLSLEECRAAAKKYDEMPLNMKEKYEDIFRNTEFRVSLHGAASHFSPWDGSISFDRDSSADTIFHECSHKLDGNAIDKTVDTEYIKNYHITSASQYLDFLASDKWKEDFETAAKLVGYETDGDGWFSGASLDAHTRFKIYHKFARQYAYSMPGYENISDVLCAMTQNSCHESFYGGHESTYWQQPYGGNLSSARSEEFWAEFCTMKICRYNDALELLKKLAPNTYAAAEQVFKEVFGDE